MSGKYFITNLCELGPDMNETCQVYRSNPNSGTFTSRQSTVRQTSCPCPKQHSVHINTITHKSEKESTKSYRNKVKHRSRSSTPKRNRPRNSNNDDVWSAVVQSTATFNDGHCQVSGDRTVSTHSHYPVLQTSSTGKIPDQSIRKNLRSCSCISAVSAPSEQNQRSMIHSCSMPTYPGGHNHIVCASEVVTHLKDDIERVKSQLDQMVDKNSEFGNIRTQGTVKQVYHLRAEIKKLKKELDQKKLLHQASVKQAEKFREVLNDYERKVTLLHHQAVKSSKIMKQTKEKFCACLKDKENMVKELKQTNEALQKSAQEKEIQYKNQIVTMQSMERELHEKIEQNTLLSDTNQNFCECIKILESKLEKSSKENSLFQKLEQTIADYKCPICEKLEIKLKKQREKYEIKIRELAKNEKLLRDDIFKLNKQAEEAASVHSVVDTLEKERQALQLKLSEIEPYVSKCKSLEEDCQKQCEIIATTEEKYKKDREQLIQLVDELTTVVEENKVTLLHLSEVNKQQEELLFSRSQILVQKDEEIKNAESQIEMLSKKSTKLEQEINEMRVASAECCNKDAYFALIEELEHLKNLLINERENKLVKDKIIEDQSNTITQLQSQIKEKTNELNIAREENSIVENEMVRVNDCLMQKHMQLEAELNEKKRLIHKLQKLEQQNSLLSSNLSQLENLVKEYCNCQNSDEEQPQVMEEFQQKVALQKREWEMQKAYLAREKDKAVKAAKFATQKLVDTVADFEKEVNVQKKVQIMLTKILHDKEEELQNVKERISSINSLSNPGAATLPLDELFRNKMNDVSEPTTTVSYSSWSNSSKHSRKNRSRSQTKQDLEEVFEAITRTE